MSKRKLKKSFKIILIFIFVIGIGIIFICNYRLLGYKREVINVFKDERIYDKVKKKDIYSKTLEEAILNDKFDVEYLDDYLNILFVDKDTFIDDINSLLKLGYNSKDINSFYDKIPNSIDVINSNDYDKDIINYLTLDYFIEDNLEKYIKYENNDNKFDSVYDTSYVKDNYNYKDTVTFVNAFIDQKYFTVEKIVDNPDSIDTIVNKYYKLNADYEPSDLKVLDSKYASGTQKLRGEAKNKFEEMCDAALDNGYKIYAGSTYRSYDYQKGLYNRYVQKDGFDKAETYSARAGYSEHQLGLAIDIVNGRWDYLSEDDPEYDWLIDNSYKYGFILRYPKNKEYVTGYMFEDWHFRYLGNELAKNVFDSGLTYEEYVAKNLKK